MKRKKNTLGTAPYLQALGAYWQVDSQGYLSLVMGEGQFVVGGGRYVVFDVGRTGPHCPATVLFRRYMFPTGQLGKPFPSKYAAAAFILNCLKRMYLDKELGL